MPSGWVLKSGGPIAFDSRSGANSLIKFGFGLFRCSFGGPEVVRWWKLIERQNRGSA